jgi:hypothetical protein
MNPETAATLAAQHRTDLRHTAAKCRRASVHRLPRWHVSWSRTTLSSSALSSTALSSTAVPSPRRGSSLVIIISASRMA